MERLSNLLENLVQSVRQPRAVRHKRTVVLGYVKIFGPHQGPSSQCSTVISLVRAKAEVPLPEGLSRAVEGLGGTS